MGNTSDFRISTISRKGALGLALQAIGPLADRLLGVRKFRLLYERHGFAGLEKHSFLAHFRKTFRINPRFEEKQLDSLPATGPLIYIGNHPLGGLEGILLSELLGTVRPDLKIIGNLMLHYIKELEDYFILVNNMAFGLKTNVRALALAGRWLKEGHGLLVFPAGRVGLYRDDKGYVTDEPWDPIALSLGLTTKASFVPIFTDARCSPLFSLLCRLIYPMKLLLLVREFLNSVGKEVSFEIGGPIPASSLAGLTRKGANAYLRMRTYLLAPVSLDAPGVRPAPDAPSGAGPIAFSHSQGDRLISRSGAYSLYRSAASNDGQETSEALYAIDGRGSIVAQCRLAFSGKAGAKTAIGADFRCSAAFLEDLAPGLEISSVYFAEGSDAALEDLFFEGIERAASEGGPRRTIFGSLPVLPPGGRKAYSPRSQALIVTGLTLKEALPRGRRRPPPKAAYDPPPRIDFPYRLHPEVEEYVEKRGMDAERLAAIVADLEGDGTGLPPLVSVLSKKGARFLSAGLGAGSIPSLLFVLRDPLAPLENQART
jgi:putative hemolysin